ncbi:hypothetical protein RE474_07140 [Methanolobus sediminis]|uniref:Uncharacterized protein n=1 Tax=Methanolobus sediminis TaxID=3072978 RepID=A0AA51YKE7_9EURY|nr:hypothetical protein [Methanolobus sediminis]WMW23879.1 hypothetical protein RE474_07140 [Methanolobus sediminis]
MNYKQIIVICFVLVFISLIVVSEKAVESSNETSQNVHFEKIEINEDDGINLQRFDSITKYDIVTVDPVAFIKDADSGKITIELSGKEYKLELEPGILMNEGSKPEIYTYNGNVVGYSESKARFTASEAGVIGRVDFGGILNIKYIIEQAGEIRRNGEKIEINVIYRSGDVEPGGTLPSSDDEVSD